MEIDKSFINDLFSRGIINETERLIILLRYFEYKTREETARILGIHQAFVRKIELQTVEVIREQVRNSKG